MVVLLVPAAQTAVRTGVRRFGDAERARTGDPSGLHHDGLQPGLVRRGARHVLRGLDERLDHHLAVAPVVVLVLEDELSERMVGAARDLAGGVEVERTRQRSAE